MLNHNGHVREFTDIDFMWSLLNNNQFMKSNDYDHYCSIAIKNLNLRKSGSTKIG